MVRRLLSVIWCLVCCLALAWGQGTSLPAQVDGTQWWNTDYNSTEGTEFYLTFMVNYGKQVQDEDLKLTVYATAREATTVTVEGIWTNWQDDSDTHPFRKQFTVPAGGVDSLTIPNEVAYLFASNQGSNPTWLNKGLKVTSTKPISLYSHNANVDSYDASLILPVEGLYKEYVIQTLPEDRQATEFAVVSSRDNNQIEIKLVETDNQGVQTRQTINVTLNQGQSYCYRPQNAFISLTGTTICSEEPMAVFQGGQHAAVQPDGANASHIYTQIFSTDFWGKHYVATRTDQQKVDVVRITAAENNTRIYKDGVYVQTLNRLETYEDEIEWGDDEYAHAYDASYAAACYLYHTSSDYNTTNYGSPALTPIVPVEQGVKSVILATFDELSTTSIAHPEADLRANYKHYANIVCPTAAIGSMKVNDTVVPAASFHPIPGTNLSVARRELTLRSNLLTNEDAIFNARVYGMYEKRRKYPSYAYSGGSNTLHPAWMLINGERVDSIHICEDEMPVNFTSVINFDYTNVRWEHHYLTGNAERTVAPTLVNSKGQTATGDSIVDFRYTITHQEGVNHHVDTVYMIVTRVTPICEYTIIDTVLAIVQVNDTFIIDESVTKPAISDVCYGDSFQLHYQGDTLTYIGDTVTTQYYNNQPFVFRLNEPYLFPDSLLTEFNCDSIVNQMRILRPTYDTLIYDTVCYQHLPYEWRNEETGQLIKVLTKDDMVNKHNLHLTQEHTFKTDSILAETVLKTQYGCDSVVRLRLLLMPDYEIAELTETVCLNSADGYIWYYDAKHYHTDASGRMPNDGVHHIWIRNLYTGENTKLLPRQRIEIKAAGTYILLDSMKTRRPCVECDDMGGCDSVHRKRLQVLEQLRTTLPDLYLCDNETVVGLNDTLCVGSKSPMAKNVPQNIPEPWRSAGRYRIVVSEITLESHSPTEDELGCDSLTIQHVKTYPTYEHTQYETICDNESLDFHGHVFAHMTGRTTPYTFDTILQTIHGCDSLIHLYLTVNPTYDTTTVDTVCEKEMPYVWQLRDKTGNHDKTITLPTDKRGTVWHYTAQTRLATAAGCDSLVQLDLTVYPTLDSTVYVPLCPEQLPYQYCENGKTLPVGYTGGEITETLQSRQFAMACDSVVKYIITVSDENIVNIPIRQCDDQPPYSYNYGTEPDGTTHTHRLENISTTGVYMDTVSIAGQCRTIYRLDFKVDPSYDQTLPQAHTCINSLPYAWQVNDTQGGTKTISITIPDGATLPYDTVCTTLLHSIYGCDSVVRLPLRVHPIYALDLYDTVCETSLPYVWKDRKNVTLQTISVNDIKSSGTWKAPDWTYQTTYNHESQYACDSVLTLHLTVYPTVDSTVYIQLCPEQLPYTYCENGKTLPVGYTGGEITETLQSRQFPMACDSVVKYIITVSDENIVNIPIRQCDDQPPYSYNYGTEPDGTTHTHRLENISVQGIYMDTVSIAGQCRTIYRLDFKVDPSYDQTLPQAHTCINSLPYAWQVNDTQGGTKTISISIPDGAALPYDTVCTTLLHSIHGCDSVVRLPLRVHPIYALDLYDTVCETSLPYVWKDRTNVTLQTISVNDIKSSGTWKAPDWTYQTPYNHESQYACDSVLTLHLTVYPTVDSTVYIQLCPEQLPYTYCENGKTVPVGYTGGEITETLQSRQFPMACDSVVKYIITVSDVDVHVVYDTVCNNYLPYNYPYPADGIESQPTDKQRLLNLYRDTVAYDTMRHDGLCMHIVELHLSVQDTSRLDTTYYLCDGAVYTDADFPAITTTRDTSYVKRLTGANAAGCDSVVYVAVRFGEGYRVHDPDVVLCEREGRYIWTTHDTHSAAGYTHVLSWDDLGEQPLDTTLYDTLHTVSPFYCDSITSVRITVNPTTYQTIWPVVCTENLPYRSDPQGKPKYASEVYNDTLQNRYGCDSVLTVHLTVLDKILTPLHVELCDDQLPYNHPTEETRLHNLTMTGIYHDTLRSHLSGCDSILELTLVVHRTYPLVIDTTYVPLCDDTAYHFKTATVDTIYNLHREWATPDQRIMRYVLTGMDTTRFGCDSAVAHVVTVYPTYAFLQDTMVCQDRENNHWIWTDEFGGAHGDVVIPITEPGTWVYADTLKTQYGCDSVFGIRVRVAPTYYIHEQQTICQDDRTDWQRRGYSGDKYGWGYERLAGDRHDEHRDSVYHHYQEGDLILKPGIYYDTARYETVDGCDSIYYLELTVQPAGHYIVDEVACENEKYHVFYSSDAYGQYTDTVFFQPITRMIDETRKDTLYYERERHLTAVQGGCDSTVHYHLTVHPSYEYVTRAKVCWDDWYEWRGRQYYAAGVYYDSIPGGTEHWGCDSVYVLELFKKPVSLIPIYDTICDNETYEHMDTLWYTNGTHSLVETMVWTPGMTVPQTYTDVIFKGTDGCDSVVYRYWLRINKTYLFDLTADICSFETYTAEGHTFTGHEHEYDTDQYIQPYDTLLTDAYLTIEGCDSIYNLHARMYPTYRHRDTITICDDETADWRGHHYAGSMLGNVLGNGLPAGEHVFRDSLLTHDHGCDSIYELHLMVMPTYLFVDSITKCADEDLSWRSFNLDHVLPGDYFYYDSLTTVTYGCDSVYHLYLTVLDTTYEIRHDSICETETYDFHGVPLTEPGFYKDTTLNAWGCHHFTYLYLYVIPPTVPTAWADSICADDKSYELFYSYTGPLDPVAYSVYYDDFGHKYGFEDIINEPITTADQLHTLILPMPWRDDDYHKYPRPDYYNIRLTLDNGVCTNPDLCSTDTSIVLSYPSWVTEQRFRDVIAILATDYNGGYTFSHYQWYRNNEPIPGETLPYLYIPRGLEQDTTWYHVRVVRVGETQDFQTCPIRIYDDFGTDTIAPYMGYLSVVPTCISTSNPVVSILSRHKGQYRVYTMEGIRVLPRDKDYGEFTPQAYPVRLDGLSAGWYIFQLWSDETPEEPHRSIKILLKDGDRTW